MLQYQRLEEGDSLFFVVVKDHEVVEIDCSGKVRTKFKADVANSDVGDQKAASLFNSRDLDGDAVDRQDGTP